MEQVGSSILSTHLPIPPSVDMHDDCDSSVQNISQLPTELMCQIFLFVRWAYETDPGLIPYSHEYLQWIQACSHVSRHWRQIAIHYPVLWNNPPLHLPELTDAMLKRSRITPLTLALDLSFSDGYRLTSAISTVTRRAPQVRSLKIWCSLSRRNFTTFLDAPTKNFTALEELFINHGQPPYPSINNNHKNVYISEGQLFSSPTLRKLIFKHVNIPWKSEIFGPAITTLSISNVSSSAKFNAEQLKSMLGRMPNLSDLCIINACRYREALLDGHKGVHLSKLNTISLGSSPDEIVFVFYNVEIPSATLTVVFLDFDNSPYVNIPVSINLQLHRWLSRLSHPCWSPESGQGVVSISQNTIDDSIYDFVFTTVVSSPGRTPSKFALGITIKPGLRDYAQGLAINRYITEVLFKQLQNSNLCSLTLDDNIDIPSDTLAETFGTLQHLTIVHVHGPCTRSLIEALQKGYNEVNTFSIPCSVPFPALLGLRLTKHHFDDWLDRNPMSLDELRTCLMRRRARGKAVFALELESCYHMVPGELFGRRELLPEEVTSLQDLVIDTISIWDE